LRYLTFISYYFNLFSLCYCCPSSSTLFPYTTLFRSSVICRSSWIADRNRSFGKSDSKPDHIRKLPFILRGHHCHVRNHGQIGQIKNPLMSLAVTSDQSASVHGKHNRKILKGHIVNDLVKAPLQERRVHRKHRFESTCGKPCCKGHCMSFCDSHVKKPFLVFPVERGKAGSVFHCSREGHKRWLLCAHLIHDFCKHISIGVFLFLF